MVALSRRPVNEFIKQLSELMEHAFRQNMTFASPFISRAYQLAIKHSAGGGGGGGSSYLAKSIEQTFNEILGASQRSTEQPSVTCSLFPLKHNGTAEAPDCRPEPSSHNLTPKSRRSVLGRAIGLVSEKLGKKRLQQIGKTATFAAGLLYHYYPAAVQTIDGTVCRLLASLFYFELDTLLRQGARTYVLTGRVLCSLCRGDPAFPALVQRVTSNCSRFLLNDQPLSAAAVAASCLSGDANFCLHVRTELEDKVAISLELDGAGPCDISGSPLSVQGLIDMQGLDMAVGQSSRKRKRPAETAEPSQKRQRRR